MLIIIDKRLPQEAKTKLYEYGDIFELETYGHVYDAISGHPDIYIFQYNKQLIIAAETPKKLIKELEIRNINFDFGNSNLGAKYPQTAAYNVAYNNGVFLGNKKYADSKIIKLALDFNWLHSPQAYARCNSLILNANTVMTSDKTVEKLFLNSLLIKPNEIILEGFDYGFFGGCAGVFEKTIFLIGSLKYHKQGNEIKEFCTKNEYSIQELYDGPLIDGGGIFFIND